MFTANNTKPTIIPASASPSPPWVPLELRIWFLATKPNMTPRMHPRPQRNPMSEHTSEAIARLLVLGA